MSEQAIAIVGLACRYPGAPDLQSLWDLVRTGRQTFRRIPPGRLDLDGYGHYGRGDDGHGDDGAPDLRTRWTVPARRP
ncbi:MAG TPA: beta-ketoacyl synthase N-terminal-like domain-containing protein [Streptosporangiaceae bacterium]|nr:beta-ketoacyl synthase N-terminal-like domain-containing protein [Streptosporangiaceae bacterium]